MSRLVDDFLKKSGIAKVAAILPLSLATGAIIGALSDQKNAAILCAAKDFECFSMAGKIIGIDTLSSGFTLGLVSSVSAAAFGAGFSLSYNHVMVNKKIDLNNFVGAMQDKFVNTPKLMLSGAAKGFKIGLIFGTVAGFGLGGFDGYNHAKEFLTGNKMTMATAPILKIS